MSWDSSTPTTSDCGNQIDDVSSDGSSNADHAVMQFDVADNVPRNAQVLEAQLGATVGYNSSSSTQQVGLYQWGPGVYPGGDHGDPDGHYPDRVLGAERGVQG